MKVGTDGVLLGAWASIPIARRVLDVGTGTGLIALMMAQRYPGAFICGVEVDDQAYVQACNNVQISPWSHRIEIIHADFRVWAPSSEDKYDLIVSNPPYFINSLRPSVEGRSLARHASQLNYESLFGKGRELLEESGRMCVILPAEVAHLALDTAAKYGLYPAERLNVYTKQGKPLKRVMLAFSTAVELCTTENLCLMDLDGSYSDSYRKIVSKFYLKM